MSCSQYKLFALLTLLLFFSLVFTGCGGNKQQAANSPANSKSPSAKTESANTKNSQKGVTKQPPKRNPGEFTETQEDLRKKAEREQRSLGDLLNQPDLETNVPPATVARMPVDDALVRARGIRKLESRFLTLYTDLPAGKQIDELPAIFDLAVPQWASYFEIDVAKLTEFRLTGFLMDNPLTFKAAGLMPDTLPEFPNGYQQGWEFWVHQQPSDYYRRHLVLHEGVHGFMNRVLGGTGPPWYSEGMAELLGTHRWVDGNLTVNYFPQDKTETPDWGRVKIVRDGYSAGKALTLEEIMRYDTTAHLRTEPYGWCWAACTFFQHHPRTREPFAKLRSRARITGFGFADDFEEALKSDWDEINEQWQLFVVNMDYGYDLESALVVHHKEPAVEVETSADATISASRGWQSTGLKLAAGVQYRIQAHGKYKVNDQPKVWWCEPAGVTIHYHQGFPLGALLGALRNEETPLRGGITPLARPGVIGSDLTITHPSGGVLYLQVNEASGELANNEGEIIVRVTRL